MKLMNVKGMHRAIAGHRRQAKRFDAELVAARRSVKELEVIVAKRGPTLEVIRALQGDWLLPSIDEECDSRILKGEHLEVARWYFVGGFGCRNDFSIDWCAALAVPSFSTRGRKATGSACGLPMARFAGVCGTVCQPCHHGGWLICRCRRWHQSSSEGQQDCGMGIEMFRLCLECMRHDPAGIPMPKTRYGMEPIGPWLRCPS